MKVGSGDKEKKGGQRSLGKLFALSLSLGLFWWYVLSYALYWPPGCVSGYRYHTNVRGDSEYIVYEDHTSLAGHSRIKIKDEYTRKEIDQLIDRGLLTPPIIEYRYGKGRYGYIGPDDPDYSLFSPSSEPSPLEWLNGQHQLRVSPTREFKFTGGSILNPKKDQSLFIGQSLIFRQRNMVAEYFTYDPSVRSTLLGVDQGYSERWFENQFRPSGLLACIALSVWIVFRRLFLNVIAGMYRFSVLGLQITWRLFVKAIVVVNRLADRAASGDLFDDKKDG